MCNKHTAHVITASFREFISVIFNRNKLFELQEVLFSVPSLQASRDTKLHKSYGDGYPMELLVVSKVSD